MKIYKLSGHTIFKYTEKIAEHFAYRSTKRIMKNVATTRIRVLQNESLPTLKSP